MGRLPLLKKISDEITIQNNKKNRWLISYTFKDKPKPQVYILLTKHLDNLSKEGAFIDRSHKGTILTDNLHGAIIASKLLKHYNAKISLYKTEEIYPNPNINLDYTFTINENELYSVMRAVHNELVNYIDSFRHSDYAWTLTDFLSSTKLNLKITYPLQMQEYVYVLFMCNYLKDGIEKRNGPWRSIALGYNVGPVMKAVENYLRENKSGITADVIVLLKEQNPPKLNLSGPQRSSQIYFPWL